MLGLLPSIRQRPLAIRTYATLSLAQPPLASENRSTLGRGADGARPTSTIAPILSSLVIGRANRGLLAEATAPEEAAASLATATKRRSARTCSHQPTNGAKWPEEGCDGVVIDGGRV
jgi:hypothetical protein